MNEKWKKNASECCDAINLYANCGGDGARL